MYKKIIGITILFLATGFLAGCSVKTTDNTPVEQKATNPAEAIAQAQRFQGASATVEDLKIGEQVMVFGKTNADGSITAEAIRIGDFSKIDFKLPTSGFVSRQRPSGTQPGGRPTDGSARPARRAMGGQAVRGEIMSKNELNLVVKLADGGSKIVFYSSKTKITKAVSADQEVAK